MSRIGIAGFGFVGQALYMSATNNDTIVIYDKYKNMGSIEDLKTVDFIFTCLPTTRLTLGGANSTRKRAMARLRGTAMTMAMKVETRVPKMLLNAPNSWSTGFHSVEKKKPKPNCLIAGQEERIKSSPMATMTRGTSSEHRKVSQRKVRSPPGEVLTWRLLTTVSGAGGTSLGPFC